jgi:hypothetical protein
MVDQNSIFGGMLTTLGANKKTNCDALGIPWEPSHMLIGDANGTDPVPSPSQTQLINQRHRAQINQLRVSPTDANVLIAEVVLPPDIGGWWIRELALEDKDGVFSAVANVAPSYKPLLSQGSGRNQVVRMHIITNGTANIQLKIDPSVVLATRRYVDEKVAAATDGLATESFVMDLASDALPKADAVAAVGHSENYAREDHVHPKDTSRAGFTDLPYRGLMVWSVAGVYQWTVPAGVTKAYVVVKGAGGSGRNSQVFGPGGGGGGVAEDLVNLIPGTVITVTVGAGGAGVAYSASGSPGLAGAGSSFGSFMSASGGGGGDASGGGGKSGTGTGGSLNYGLGDGQSGGRTNSTSYGFPGSGGGPGGAGAVVDSSGVGQTLLRNGQGPGGGGGGRMDNGGFSGAGAAGSVSVRW